MNKNEEKTVLISKMSPPIYVDSRKSARDTVFSKVFLIF